MHEILITNCTERIFSAQQSQTHKLCRYNPRRGEHSLDDACLCNTFITGRNFFSISPPSSNCQTWTHFKRSFHRKSTEPPLFWYQQKLQIVPHLRVRHQIGLEKPTLLKLKSSRFQMAQHESAVGAKCRSGVLSPSTCRFPSSSLEYIW